MMHKKSRTRNIFATVFPKSVSETLTIRTFIFHMKLVELSFHISLSCRKHIDASLLQNFTHVFHNRPFTREIKRVSTSSELSLAEYFHCNLLIHHLCKLHTVVVVGVSPIEFHIGEFLQVVGARAFIAIGTANFKCLWKPCGHQALLPKLTD